MKKILVLALVVLVAISTVFAVDGFAGLSTGYQMRINFPEKADPVTSNLVPVMGVLNLDVADSLALGVNLGTTILVPESEHVDASADFALDVLALYRMELDKKVNFYAGGGLGYNLRSYADGLDLGFITISGKGVRHTLWLDVDARGEYEVADNISIFADALLGFRVLDGVKASGSIGGASGSTEFQKNEDFGMRWALTVGAAYRF